MWSSKNRYSLSLLLACAMVLTLAFTGCGSSKGSDGEINWNVGSDSKDGSGDSSESSGAQETTISGETADTTSPDTQGPGATNPGSNNTKRPTNASNGPTDPGKPPVTMAATYYVDSVNGKDTNVGTSDRTPLKTLAKVPHGTLAPGSKVLLKAGSFFKETMNISASGTASALIIYDKYGSGAKPIIDGCGEMAAVTIYNAQYVEIKNLEIINVGKGNPIKRGISVTSGGRDHPGGAMNHIYMQNLTIHKLSAKVGRGAAGIYVENGQSMKPCYYNDLRIEGCDIYDTGSCGIIFNSNYGKRPEVPNWTLQPLPFTPATNVIIRNNIVRDMPGDGMWISTTKGAVMEYNTVYNTSYSNNTAYAGMWPHNSDGAIMQYNEVYNNRKGGGDGQGLDVDINCKDTLVQYNYSHENEGGFILICTDGEANNFNRGTTVRYNISQNDLSALISIYGISVTDVEIYNNTFYTNKGYYNATMDCMLWNQSSCSITNNVFVNDGTNSSGLYGRFINNRVGGNSNEKVNVTFENNAFYGSSAAIAPKAETGVAVSATNKIGVNPGLTNPGKGGIGRNTASGYQLKSNSPCLNAGKAIPNNGGKDFFGGSVSGTPSIGAHQG